MKLEVLTAKELREKGEIGPIEAESFDLFGGKKVIIFQKPQVGNMAMYDFYQDYVIHYELFSLL